MPVTYVYEINHEKWHLSQHQFAWLLRNHPKPPVYVQKDTEGLWKGHTAIVLAPGPSLSEFPQDAVKGKLTVALNSALFWTPPRYVCIAETTWINWFRREAVLVAEWKPKLSGMDFLLGGRTGAWWQMQHLPFRRIYYMRHDEDGRVPPDGKIAGATIWNALAQCAWMGCSRTMLVGADLCRDQAAPYAAGLPHNPAAEADDLQKQRVSLMGATFKGMEIIHCSPRSPHMGLPWTSVTLEQGIEIARSAPEVTQQ